MAEMLGKTGKVMSLLSNGGLRVLGKCWAPSLVEFIRRDAGGPLQVGDKVKIRLVSVSEASKLQEGHGGWASDMSDLLGKSGTIERIDSDGDVLVLSKMWNAELLEKEKQPRLQVGECVVLTPDFASQDDAASGCLKPGDVGVLEQDDHDSKPFKVRFKGRTFYYVEAALCRAPEGSKPDQAPASSAMVNINAIIFVITLATPYRQKRDSYSVC